MPNLPYEIAKHIAHVLRRRSELLQVWNQIPVWEQDQIIEYWTAVVRVHLEHPETAYPEISSAKNISLVVEYQGAQHRGMDQYLDRRIAKVVELQPGICELVGQGFDRTTNIRDLEFRFPDFTQAQEAERRVQEQIGECLLTVRVRKD